MGPQLSICIIKSTSLQPDQGLVWTWRGTLSVEDPEGDISSIPGGRLKPL